MKIKVITVATKENEGLEKLKQSCKNNGIDLAVVGMGRKWQGFGTKIILLYEYLKTLKDHTHFIFVDAYDVVLLKNLKNIEAVYREFYNDQIVFSTEKGCWPQPDLASQYPDSPTPWKYLNSGAYIAPIKKYLDYTKDKLLGWADDDQLYYTKLYLSGGITLDYNCRLFQSYSFIADGEFDYGRVLFNNVTKTEPAIVHGNGRTDMTEVYKISDNQTYNSIDAITSIWQPTEEYNKQINESFIRKVNENDPLKLHRDWVEAHAWGFGERSFQWMWKLLIQEMPENFTFLEIGVFRGQILSLVELISSAMGKKAIRYGVTPLSPAEINWQSDYAADIKKIHDTFNLDTNYTIIKGDSTDPEIIKQSHLIKGLDILYIDGCHAKHCVQSDIKNYTPLLKVGGYLVIDDSASRFPMPWGYFTGIQTVCEGVDELLPPAVPNEQYEHLFNIVHNRVWKKINVGVV